MGRREPPRLRRVPARLVASHPLFVVTSRGRSCWSGGRAGAPGSALHIALSRAALGAGDGGAPRRLRAGPPREVRDQSSPAPKASRSTRSRPCACCSTADCWCRRARPTARPGEIEALEVPETLHGLIAARLDGLPAEERRLLQDAAVLGKTFTQDALAALVGSPSRARPAPRCARPQGGARRAGRPPLARARPVRLPPGPRAPRRLRDALEATSEEPAPRRRRSPRARVRGRRGRDRRGRRLALPRGLRGRARRRRRRRDQRQGAGDARAGRRARRVARRGRRGAALFRAGSGAHRGAVERAQLLGGRGRWPRGGRPGLGARGCSRRRSSSTRRRATRMPPRACSGGSGGSTPSRGVATRRWRGWSAPSPSSPATSPTRISRSSRRAWLGYLFARRTRARGRAGRAGARHRRGACVPGGPRIALRAKAAVVAAEASEEALRTAGTRSRSPSSTTSRTTRAPPTSSSPTGASGATVRARRSATSTRRSRSRGGSGTVRSEWSVLAERTYPLAMLGRWDEALRREEFTPEQSSPAGSMLSMLQSAVEIHIQRGELDDARRVCSCSPRLEESPDVQERSGYLGSRAALAGRRAAHGGARATARRRSRRAARSASALSP